MSAVDILQAALDAANAHVADLRQQAQSYTDQATQASMAAGAAAVVAADLQTALAMLSDPTLKATTVSAIVTVAVSAPALSVSAGS